MTDVRRSRFYAHFYRVEGPEDIAGVLAGHREAYRKAAHHCAALRCGSLEEFRNDGEVGRPGRILLDVLRRHALESHALVVSRIFGGILPGPGNVGQAFREAVVIRWRGPAAGGPGHPRRGSLKREQRRRSGR